MNRRTASWRGRAMRVCALVALSLWISLPLHGAGPTTLPAHTPFVSVLLRDWDRLDANHDGVLSLDEIDRAVADPSIKGDDAALAGTLKVLSRSTRVKVPPLTRQYFLDYDRKAITLIPKISPAAAEAATADTVSSAPPAAPATGPSLSSNRLPINWDLYFSGGEKRLARGGNIVWPDKETLDNMRQGPLGDCFLVATIGSMVVHRPDEVNQLIRPLPDGQFLVAFPQSKPFTLHPLTQSELVISSTSSGEGIWLAALEQAFGRYREAAKGSSDEEGTDIIAAGGQPGATMSLLTGHKFKRVYFATTAARRVPEEARMLAMVRENLITALKNGRLITATVTPPVLVPTTNPATQPASVAVRPSAKSPTTRPVITAAMLPKIPPNINTRHAYAVVGYDEKTDMLEIWNPHGQAFTPKGADGLQNGYTTVHGRFHIPLREAYCFFTSFFFELPEPATMPVTAPVASR